MAFWGFWLHHLVRVIEIVLQAVRPTRAGGGTINLCDLPTRECPANYRENCECWSNMRD